MSRQFEYRCDCGAVVEATEMESIVLIGLPIALDPEEAENLACGLMRAAQWLRTVAGLTKEQPALPTVETIGVLKLPTRFHSALWYNGIKTMADLMALSEWELRRIPNLGKKSVAEIKAKLEERGINLADRLRLERRWAIEDRQKTRLRERT